MGEPPSIGLADSALATPHAGFGDYEAYPSLIEKAAVLVERLARNHPLPDGNKRAAFLSLDRFLAANGARADVMLGSQNYSVSESAGRIAASTAGGGDSGWLPTLSARWSTR